MDIRRLWMWAALLGALGVAACDSAEAGRADQGAEGVDYVRVINVEVEPVVPQDFVEEIRLTAVAVANQDVLLAAEESGVIREWYVDHGARVSEGQELAKIDDRVLTAQVNQARAAADLAAQTWDRRRRLWEEDRVGSEIAYLEARYSAEQTAASLQALEERLARTVIRAPFDGVLDERRVDAGAMVNPGTTVGRLVNLRPIKVMAGVPERYAADVHVGDEAALSFESLGGEAYRGPVSYVGSTVNPENRTFTVEVVLPNPNRMIKPQMVADMSLTRQKVANAIVVPQDALIRVEDGYVVFVAVDRDGQPVAEERRVEMGPRRRNLVVLTSGLDVGDRLIVVGHKEVENGDRLNIVGERG